MSRPPRLAVIAGTGTGVGKTWVAARLAEHLTAGGLRVAARKPAQSYEPGTGPTDADILGSATGEPPQQVCPPHRWYEKPMAPFMAADALGRPPFTLTELLAEIRWPDGIDIGLIETAGGVRSPITSDGADTIDLTRALDPELVILVADAGLGTINAVRLSAAAIDNPTTIIFLNRHDPTDDLHRRNQTWLTTHLQPPLPVLTSIGHLTELVTTARPDRTRTAPGRQQDATPA
jgi:dethiobiotin synthetase